MQIKEINQEVWDWVYCPGPTIVLTEEEVRGPDIAFDPFIDTDTDAILDTLRRKDASRIIGLPSDGVGVSIDEDADNRADIQAAMDDAVLCLNDAAIDAVR